jgi:hypothetical protein
LKEINDAFGFWSKMRQTRHQIIQVPFSVSLKNIRNQQGTQRRAPKPQTKFGQKMPAGCIYAKIKNLFLHGSFLFNCQRRNWFAHQTQWNCAAYFVPVAVQSVLLRFCNCLFHVVKHINHTHQSSSLILIHFRFMRKLTCV